MTSSIVPNIIRFLLLTLLQALIFKEFAFGWGGRAYFQTLIYPLFILLLPMNFPRWLIILFAFIMGITLDVFYNSPGVHASASVFTAFIREPVLALLEPREGYSVNMSLTMQKMGSNWFFRYAGIMLAIHLFFYFSVDAFTFVYIFDILLKTFFSFIISIALIMMIMIIFNPKN